jgi:hypothetical protein
MDRISYMSDEKQNHLFGKHVQLKLMNIATKQIQVITPVFYGGQGQPSWILIVESSFCKLSNNQLNL